MDELRQAVDAAMVEAEAEVIAAGARAVNEVIRILIASERLAESDAMREHLVRTRGPLAELLTLLESR